MRTVTTREISGFESFRLAIRSFKFCHDPTPALLETLQFGAAFDGNTQPGQVLPELGFMFVLRIDQYMRKSRNLFRLSSKKHLSDLLLFYPQMDSIQGHGMIYDGRLDTQLTVKLEGA